MSLEKEFLFYSSKLHQQESCSTDSTNSNSYNQFNSDSTNNTASGLVEFSNDKCIYLKLKLLLTKEILHEINIVSQTLGISPQSTLANYLQYANDLKLVPLTPKNLNKNEEDYDAIYYLESNESYYNDLME